MTDQDLSPSGSANSESAPLGAAGGFGVDLSPFLAHALADAVNATNSVGGCCVLESGVSSGWEAKVQLKLPPEVIAELVRAVPPRISETIRGAPPQLWTWPVPNGASEWPHAQACGIRQFAVLPLAIQGRIIAALILGQPNEAPKEGPAWERVRDLGSALALFIDNSLLVQRLTLELAEREQAEAAAVAARQRLELITRISGSLVGRQTVAELARYLSAQVKELFQVDACIIRLQDVDELELLGAAGVPEEQLPQRMKIFGLGQQILSSRQPLVIQNVFTNPLTRDLTNTKPTTFTFVSYAGVPLLVESQPVGVLGVYTNHQPREFTTHDLNHLQIFANHVASVLVNERLFRTVCDQQASLAREVNERRRAEAEREQLEQQLRQSQKLESIGQLAAGIAHDFNNLLTVINGNATLLQEDLAGQPLARETVQEIIAAGDRAANLTRQLLLFSRKQHMQLCQVDFNQLVASLTRMLGRMLGENVALEFAAGVAVPHVIADRSMIEQAIINLALNGRDAMAQGGKLRITTNTMELPPAQATDNPDRAAGAYVVLSVQDTGAGIAPEIRGKIFEPFFTTKEAGHGTGLGLSTVYGIMKQHHGWVEFESTVGAGSTFQLFLPAARSTELVDDAGAVWELAVGSGEIILLVEDDRSVRNLLGKLLRRQGYCVIEKATGVEALAGPEPDWSQVKLLITDLVLPGGCSGRQLVQRVRQAHPKLPVIYCSGYSSELAAVESDLAADTRFIQKPIQPVQFLLAVGALLHPEATLPPR